MNSAYPWRCAFCNNYFASPEDFKEHKPFCVKLNRVERMDMRR